MKLIKLEKNFILVNDEEILIDDNYVAWETNYATEPKERWVIYNRLSGLNGTNQHKIISEKPDFSLLKEEDCKEIGYIDVEKLFYNIYPLAGVVSIDSRNQLREEGFIEGFKTTQSLNDKQFSLEDMKKLASAAFTVKSHNETLIEDFDKWFNKRIQSLQKTEWDVEVERECVYQGKCVKERCLMNSCDEKQPKIIDGKVKVTKIL